MNLCLGLTRPERGFTGLLSQLTVLARIMSACLACMVAPPQHGYAGTFLGQGDRGGLDWNSTVDNVGR